MAAAEPYGASDDFLVILQPYRVCWLLPAQHGGGEGASEVGFGLPAGETRREEAAVVRRSVELLAASLRAHDATAFPPSAAVDVDDISAAAAASASAAGSGEAAEGPRVARGPAMPSAADLAKARALPPRGPALPPRGAMPPPGHAARPLGYHDSESDDDDGPGPMLPGQASHHADGGEEDDEEAAGARASAKRQRREAEWALVRAGKSAAEAAAQVAAAEAKVRIHHALNRPPAAGGAVGFACVTIGWLPSSRRAFPPIASSPPTHCLAGGSCPGAHGRAGGVDAGGALGGRFLPRRAQTTGSHRAGLHTDGAALAGLGRAR